MVCWQPCDARSYILSPPSRHRRSMRLERRSNQRLSWLTPVRSVAAARPWASVAALFGMTASSAVIATPSSSDIFSITQASGWAEFFNKYGFMGVGLFLFLLAVSFFLLGRDRVVTYILGCIGLLLLVLFAGIRQWWSALSPSGSSVELSHPPASAQY